MGSQAWSEKAALKIGSSVPLGRTKCSFRMKLQRSEVALGAGPEDLKPRAGLVQEPGWAAKY